MTADHERARSLAAKYPEIRAAVEAEFPQPWHGYGVIAQAIFFVLTSIGVFAFYMLFDAPIVTAAVAIALAESLIWGRRWFGTGVEAALWIGGLFAALQALPNTGAPEANLLIALVCAVSGLRVRNPLFGGLAAFFVTRYLEIRFDLGTLAALTIATIALFALFRTWRRPSTEWLFTVLAVTMPLAGLDHADGKWRPITIALYAAFTVLAFACAVGKRHHWMFAAAGSGAFVVGWEVHEFFEPPDEVSLAIAGAFLLAVAWGASRLLRGRTTGFVLAPAPKSELAGAVEILGTMAAAPTIRDTPSGDRPQGGGEFGGAGASGNF